MSNIIEKIKKIPKLYHATGCSEIQLAEAQNVLNLTFPKEFQEYVREYGAISFYGTEWMGLNVDAYVNVMDATRQERELNPDFPADCFVIENLGIEGIVSVINQKGEVFEVQGEKKTLVCGSLEEYLEKCIERAG